MRRKHKGRKDRTPRWSPKRVVNKYGQRWTELPGIFSVHSMLEMVLVMVDDVDLRRGSIPENMHGVKIVLALDSQAESAST